MGTVTAATKHKRRASSEDPTKGPSGVFRAMLLLAREAETEGVFCVFCECITILEGAEVLEKRTCPECGWSRAHTRSLWLEGFLNMKREP